MQVDSLTKDAILRVGIVSEVHGRIIDIEVDKNKNLSDLFFDGDIIKNISVNSFIEIRKGFLSIIGKVEGEKIKKETVKKEVAGDKNNYKIINENRRYLSVALSGYIDNKDKFIAGTKELPLIGNEAYIVTKDKIHQIHNLARDSDLSICIARTDNDDFDVNFPIDNLFNTHIAIFGNTGSGKSNTLAHLYQKLINILSIRNPNNFFQNTHFILFDFNGEYAGSNCITKHKKIFNLSTRQATDLRLPLKEDNFLDLEFISILSDATEKTQKPFLGRTLRFYKKVRYIDGDSTEYLQNILRKYIEKILLMSDKPRAFQLIDYLRQILPSKNEKGEEEDIASDIDYHGQHNDFFIVGATKDKHVYLHSDPAAIKSTIVYKRVDKLEFSFESNLLSNIIYFLYLQLILDVIANRAQNEHIAPVINKLKSKKNDIEKIFTPSDKEIFEDANFVVVNMHDVNLDMKKAIPLLLCKMLYSEHKQLGNEKSLNIIIDEAHNILSKESFREAESWKDYRLETFEEIIKEGRKFGVFMTISSQRPNDISQTITSQAHNYFIHRLINQKDLAMISNAVSYIDKVTEESIPTLPIGTCIFSGIASQMPLKVNIKPLPKDSQPHSSTLEFNSIVPKKNEPPPPPPPPPPMQNKT